MFPCVPGPGKGTIKRSEKIGELNERVMISES